MKGENKIRNKTINEEAPLKHTEKEAKKSVVVMSCKELRECFLKMTGKYIKVWEQTKSNAILSFIQK